MATIEERKQQLEKKLKKMAEDNVVVKPVTVPNPFDPSEDIEPSLATSREEDKGSEEMKTAKEERTDETGGEEIGNTEPKRERKPRMEKSGRSSLSIEEYRSLYFHPVRSQMRTAFSINLETLQNLRNVLQDLGERVSIASYIDNPKSVIRISLCRTAKRNPLIFSIWTRMIVVFLVIWPNIGYACLLFSPSRLALIAVRTELSSEISSCWN